MAKGNSNKFDIIFLKFSVTNLLKGNTGNHLIKGMFQKFPWSQKRQCLILPKINIFLFVETKYFLIILKVSRFVISNLIYNLLWVVILASIYRTNKPFSVMGQINIFTFLKKCFSDQRFFSISIGNSLNLFLISFKKRIRLLA